MGLLSLGVLEQARLSLGKLGRRTGRPGLLSVFVWLSVPAALLVGYHLNFQVYVLRAEVLLSAFALLLLGLEAVLALVVGIAIAGGALERVVTAIGFGIFLSVLVAMSSI